MYEWVVRRETTTRPISADLLGSKRRGEGRQRNNYTANEDNYTLQHCFNSNWPLERSCFMAEAHKMWLHKQEPGLRTSAGLRTSTGLRITTLLADDKNNDENRHLAPQGVKVREHKYLNSLNKPNAKEYWSRLWRAMWASFIFSNDDNTSARTVNVGTVNVGTVGQWDSRTEEQWNSGTVMPISKYTIQTSSCSSIKPSSRAVGVSSAPTFGPTFTWQFWSLCVSSYLIHTQNADPDTHAELQTPCF